jgi:predicted nucleic acid-binding protein
MLIVDTNVLVDVLEDDPDWAEWSIGQLRAQAQVQELVINPIIYAELSLAFATVEALDAAVDQMRLTHFCATGVPVVARATCCRTSSLAPMPRSQAARCSPATFSVTAPTFPRLS